MGTSLLTNQSAMNALQTLRSIGDSMDQTQRRVSTGLRINEASDNTAYWSISSMMKSDRNALSSVSDAMALGKSQIDVANATIDKSKEYLDNIQKSLTTAYQKGSGDVAKIQADIKANMNDIESAVYSASLAEKNILGNGGQSVRIAGSYRREGSAVYVDMIDVGGNELNFATKGANGTFDLSGGVLKDVFGSYDTGAADGSKISDLLGTIKDKKAELDAAKPSDTDYGSKKDAYNNAVTALTNVADKLTVKDFANADFSNVSASGMETIIKAIQSKVTGATSAVVTAGATLGAAKAQVTGQIDYVSKLMDAVDKGVGSLVDADMNAESARLASLQVQQQLGIQALSIANQNSQNILSLFRQ
ncbi:C-terminal domain [Bartonella apihabitans]|uniref:flagellin N-terminal helical domain-containing protein n=1 Tax=Bartonella TaxID=773 RepID=UPI0018DD1BF5|nr:MULTISPECIES: flagellin [Bartonella]MBI0000984.1 flagellin [Bartonella sp. W8122]MBI0025461.1 flagellin [Bartonella apihabitans]